MKRFSTPFRSVLEVMGWVARDPMRPNIWSTLGLAGGVVWAQYFQTFLIFLLITVFSQSESGASSISLVGVSLNDIVPKQLFIEYPVVFAVSLAGLFALQSYISFLSRKGLVAQAMGYYQAHTNRAINYYEAGMLGRLPKEDLLIEKDMLISFSLREARYIGTGFLSLSNAVSGLIAASIGLIIIFLMDWQLTLILMCVVIGIFVLLAPFVTSGTQFSRDILAGSGDMLRDVRGHLTDAEIFKDDPRALRQHLDMTLDLPGSIRFVNALRQKILLSYHTTLRARIGFSVLFGVVAAVFLQRFKDGTMAPHDITTYCIFLLPLFSATSSLVNSIIGVTTSKPYFENYFMIFGDPKRQRAYIQSTSKEGFRLQAAPSKEPVDQAESHQDDMFSDTVLLLAPINGLDWPVYQRLKPFLVSSGVMRPAESQRVIFVPDVWPSRTRSLGNFFQMKDDFDLDKASEKNPKLAKLFEDEMVNLKLEAHPDGGIDLSNLRPKQRCLLALMAAIQGECQLILSMRSFGAFGESERTSIVNLASNIGILLISPRIPHLRMKPFMDKTYALNLATGLIPIQAEDILNPPPEIASSLQRESFTYIGAEDYDPELVG